MKPIRLQKFLSMAGRCSRRRGEVLIQSGRVAVNGKTETTLGTKVDPDKDRVTVDGRDLRLEQNLIYLALNKPEGYVTTCDQADADIVMSLINLPERVYPVGRLDKDSAGLLLLTNDGRLHHRLSHPSFDHEKEYVVTTARPVSDADLKKMAEGLPLDGRMTRKARIRRRGPKRFAITLKEGRNRQIRRMVGRLGNQVVRLKRIRIAHIRLGRLPEGEWRRLSGAEIREFERILQEEKRKKITKNKFQTPNKSQ